MNLSYMYDIYEGIPKIFLIINDKIYFKQKVNTEINLECVVNIFQYKTLPKINKNWY